LDHTITNLGLFAFVSFVRVWPCSVDIDLWHGCLMLLMATTGRRSSDRVALYEVLGASRVRQASVFAIRETRCTGGRCGCHSRISAVFRSVWHAS